MDALNYNDWNNATSNSNCEANCSQKFEHVTHLGAKTYMIANCVKTCLDSVSGEGLQPDELQVMQAPVPTSSNIPSTGRSTPAFTVVPQSVLNQSRGVNGNGETEDGQPNLMLIAGIGVAAIFGYMAWKRFKK